MNRLRMVHRAGVAAAKRELQHLEARRAKLVESIMEGVPGREVKDELIGIGARRDELERQLTDADQAPPLLHPNMADLYREKVAGLAEALEHPDTRPEATETLRGLIDEITLIPVDGTLQIELKGNLAAMLGAAQNAKRSPETGDLSLQTGVVAGAVRQRAAEGGEAAGNEMFKSWPRNPTDTKGVTAFPSPLQIALVAGARNQRYLQLWSAAA